MNEVIRLQPNATSSSYQWVKYSSSWVPSLQLDGVVLGASMRLWVPTDFGVRLSVVSMVVDPLPGFLRHLG